MKNYYKIIEADPIATQEKIKPHSHLVLHAWHPDKFPSEGKKLWRENK